MRQVGSIMGGGALLGLMLRPWMAQWINRLGARAMWGIGYAAFGCAAMANLWLYDIGWQIYVVRSSLFVGTAIVFTSGLTYISQTAPDHRRTEAIGIFGIGGFLGMLLGPLLGETCSWQNESGSIFKRCLSSRRSPTCCPRSGCTSCAQPKARERTRQ